MLISLCVCVCFFPPYLGGNVLCSASPSDGSQTLSFHLLLLACFSPSLPQSSFSEEFSFGRGFDFDPNMNQGLCLLSFHLHHAKINSNTGKLMLHLCFWRLQICPDGSCVLEESTVALTWLGGARCFRWLTMALSVASSFCILSAGSPCISCLVRPKSS